MLAFPKLTVLQITLCCWNLLLWGCFTGQPLKEAWSWWLSPQGCCCLWCRDTRFSAVLLVLHPGWREEPGSGKQGWAVDEVPRVLESSWEPVCGPRTLAGLALCLLCLPATCRPDVVWGKVQPWSRDCWVLKNNHLPLLSFHPPTPSPCRLGQILPYCRVCLSRGGGGEVVWTHCLLFNYQQSSWAWLNVWCCCFLRLLMKGCLELDENSFALECLR